LRHLALDGENRPVLFHQNSVNARPSRRPRGRVASNRAHLSGAEEPRDRNRPSKVHNPALRRGRANAASAANVRHHLKHLLLPAQRLRHPDLPAGPASVAKAASGRHRLKLHPLPVHRLRHRDLPAGPASVAKAASGRHRLKLHPLPVPRLRHPDLPADAAKAERRSNPHRRQLRLHHPLNLLSVRAGEAAGQPVHRPA
jgi:hypothetical protein